MLHKITPLYVSLLGHKDRITISNRVYGVLISLLSEDKDCLTFLSTVKEQNSALKYALSNVKKPSVFTPRLRNVVLERVVIITYIKKFIETQSLYFLDNKIQKAARMLTFELNHAIRANKIRNYAGGSIAAEEIIEDVVTIARARKTRQINHDDEETGENMHNVNVVEQAA